MDLSLTADLAGDGRILRAVWYRLGPIPETPPNPPSFVRGLAIAPLHDDSHLLAKWESGPTTIPDFYPRLNGIHSEPGSKRKAIFATVQYGGATIELHAFTFDGQRLTSAGKPGGRAIWVEHMGNPPTLVVRVRPSDLDDIYELYAWNGKKLARADGRFPEFWSRIGGSFRDDILGSKASSSYAIRMDCQLALRAYARARSPSLGARACNDAKGRLASGRNLLRPSIGRDARRLPRSRGC